jgi:catalase-peroxidase
MRSRAGFERAHRDGARASRASNGVQPGGNKISLADPIVRAGSAAVEAAAAQAGQDVEVPFVPDRVGASRDQTDVESFAVPEPKANGFPSPARRGLEGAAAELLVDKAHQPTLSAPETTVRVGSRRARRENRSGPARRLRPPARNAVERLRRRPARQRGTEWQQCASADAVPEGRERKTGEPKWTGTVVDLRIGSNSQRRALAGVCASRDALPRFVRDVVAAGTNRRRSRPRSISTDRCLGASGDAVA